MTVNLRDALEVYEILAPHLPKDISTPLVEYAKDVIQSIQSSDPSGFFTLLILMTGYTKEELLNTEPSSLYNMFVQSLIDNEILRLVEFLEGFGYGSSR